MRTTSLVSKLALCCCLLAGNALTTRAVSIVWTNTAGGNWNNTNNWSPNQLPVAADTAYITNAGTYTVMLNVSSTLAALTVGGGGGGIQTLANAGLTLILNGTSFVDSNGVFALSSSGVLDGSGELNVAGAFNWAGGFQQGTGKTVITNSGTLTVNGVGHRYLRRNLDLRGNGSYTYNGYYLYGGNGAVFTIFNGATFELFGGAQMAYEATGNAQYARLQNNGTFRKTSGVADANVTWIVNSAGLLQSQQGVLSLDAGGIVAGQYDASGAGTVVNFGGLTHSVTNGANFTASSGGLHRCNNGTLSFDIGYTFNPTFQLLSAGGIGGNAEVNFTGLLDWQGGYMYPSGKTTVTNSGTLTVNGVGHRYLRRNLDLRGNGSYTYNGYYLYGGNGAVFTIFNGATFELFGGAQMAYEATGNAQYARLQNNGTFRKTSGVADANINYACTNTGTVDSQSGTLSLDRSYVQTSGQTLLSGGNYAGTTLDIQGGVLTGAGNIAAHVINNAQVAPGTGVGLTTISNTIVQNYTSTTNSLVSFQLAGLTPGSGHDQLRLNNGTATLAGTLMARLTNGYVPTAGNTYTVMVFTARSGVFTNFSFPDYDFGVVQTMTNVILIASNAPPVVSLAGPTNQLVCVPFVLQSVTSDLDGAVTNLQFLLNGSTVLANITNPPAGVTQELAFTYDFPGTATFTARATDNKGSVRSTNLVTVFETLPLHVLNLGGMLTNGAFKFCMLGETGSNYMALANTNIQTTNWVSLGLMERTNGIWRYTDTGATNFPRRYYRALQSP